MHPYVVDRTSTVGPQFSDYSGFWVSPSAAPEAGNADA